MTKQAAVVLVTRDDGKVLSVSRGPGSKLWALPGGKCEPGEELEHCAVRELWEETGLALAGPRLLYSARNAEFEVFAYAGDVGGNVRGSDEGDVAWKDPSFLVDPQNSPYPTYTFNLFRSVGIMKMDLGLDDVHAPSAGQPPKKAPSGRFADPKNRSFPMHDAASLRASNVHLERQKGAMTRGQYSLVKQRLQRADKKLKAGVFGRRGSQRMSLTIDHPRHGRIEIRHMKGEAEGRALDVVLLDGKDGPLADADQVHWYVMGLADQAVQLASKDGKPAWIQLAIPGTYCQKGVWFELNDRVFSDVVRNFEASQNQHVPVDFEHASEAPGSEGQIPMLGAPAQGWIKQLKNRGGRSGLWAEVHWGDLAREYIRNENYRYISPTIRFNQKSRTTGEPIGALLSSAGLVNIPFLDGMKPLTAKDQDMTDVVNSALEQFDIDKARIDSDRVGSFKASQRAFSSSEYMPKVRACLGMHEMSTAAECRDQLDRLRGHYAAAGDVNATPQGVQLSKYMLPMRDAAGAGVSHTWDDVFDMVEEMIDDAMAEHVEEYHEEAKLEAEDEDAAQAIAAKDADEAAAASTENNAIIEAIASPTGDATMAETIEVQLKNVQDERAELSVKLKNTETSLVDVTLQLKSTTAELGTLKAHSTAADAELVTLKAEIAKRDDQALNDEVSSAILSYKDKGVSEADRSDLVALLKASPSIFRKHYPKVSPALAHLTRSITTPKGNVTGGEGGAPGVQLDGKGGDGAVVVEDQKVLIAKFRKEGMNLEDACSKAFETHQAQLATASRH